jgi:phospholipid/cholesterol/gamma-HCH transport system substrate-binding protein
VEPGGAQQVSQRQNIKVGVFVIGLSVTMLLTVFVLGGSTEMLENRYTLQGKWEDVAGLKEGAVVRLAGWDVGEVKSIEFSDSLDQKELTVQMTIMERYQSRIRSDSEARIDTVGVLGDKYVAISMGSPSEKGLDHNDFIVTRAPLDILGYTKKFEDILHNTSSISRKFDLMLGTDDEAAQAKVGASMAHVEELLKGVKEGTGLLNAMVYDEEMPRRVKSIMRNLDTASAGMSGVMDEVRTGDGLANELIYGDQGASLARELGSLANTLSKLTNDIRNEDSMVHAMIYDADKAQVVDDLAATVASLRRTSEALENGQGSLGLLAHDPALYEDLRALVGGAQRNKLLRNYIRQTIEKGEVVNAGAWTPQESE